MAEGGKDQSSVDNSWEGWFGGWVQTAKEKSTVAMEMVKKDLTEFSTIMQKETEKVVEKTSSQLKDSLNSENTAQATGKMKAGLTSFLDSVSKVLVIPPDEDDSVPMKVSADGSGLYDKGKLRLHALQLDVDTYIDPPRGPPEQFTMWRESFDLDQHKGDISDLLVSKVEVRALYTKLVPSEVSHAEFWQRYFYRVHQLDLDEARKKALMQRADQTRGDSLGWDDDDDDDWSDGDEDDGNQSDWEKLPKPNQTKKPSSSKPSPLPKVQNSETTSTSNISQISEQINKTESINVKSSNLEEDSDKKEKVFSSKPESATDLPAIEVKASPSDNNDAKSPPQNSSNDSENNVAGVPDLAGSQLPSSDLWSLHIPDDTASAAQDEIAADIEGGDTTGSAPSPQDQTSTVNDASTCGAAAGGDSLSAKVNVNTADGACGAIESPPPVSDAIESPAASAPSAQSKVTREETPDAPVIDAPVIDAEASGEAVELMQEADVSEAKNTQLSDQDAAEKMAMKVKGDMVVVGDRESPSSEESSEAKDVGLEDDWDEDFDVDLTEEDLKAAEDIAKRLGEGTGEDDDWENWE